MQRTWRVALWSAFCGALILGLGACDRAAQRDAGASGNPGTGSTASTQPGTGLGGGLTGSFPSTTTGTSAR